MPTPADPRMDECEELLAAWQEHRAVLRRALAGLTEEQARSTPSVSTLSLASLITHAVRGEPEWIPVIAGRGADWLQRDGQAEFEVPASATVAGLLAEHERVGAEVAQAVRAVKDFDERVPMPKTPWGPQDEPRTVRWILLHLIGEAARHAGHADVIRESLDGANAFDLQQAAPGA